MGVNLQYTKRAVKDLRKLDPQIRRRVKDGLESFAAGKKTALPLTGELEGLHKLRLGDYRIILDKLSGKSYIVRYIRHRRDAYD